MKYLGVEIVIDNRRFELKYHIKLNIGDIASNNLEDIKKCIRENKLKTYQPTKALKWLEGKGYGVYYEQEARFLRITNEYFVISYDVLIGAVYVRENRHNGCDVLGTYSEYAYMIPREFIEKIEKGEWV